ncbi:cytoplasmic tRNA 2-thiolation protein 2 [Orbilia brochopaga]|uniref:Cytoplasmic tRNA 2-thiolation protein 2 n=1 Tax=Orbilia brochopaga TaxID=3140254 RepID=A0AAV9UW32_9PEZI
MDQPMEFEVTMADIAKSSADAADALCRRCRAVPPAVTIRTEPLCAACFTTYLRTKFTRHMEPFRVKPGTEINRRRLLLALSFGVASTALLDILHWHRSLQLQRARRAEYDVLVVHIDESAVASSSTGAVDAQLEKLRGQYEQFEFRSIPLHHIYELPTAIGDTLPDEIAAELEQNGDGESTNADANPLSRLRALLSRLNSRASQVDVIAILRARLLAELAKINGCEAVMLGDSMTRMAAMVLAEVTKGRGHSLPWLISDGPTPYGPSLVRPLRDLTTSELNHYLSFTDIAHLSNATSSAPKPPVAAKNQTIDEIMIRFFDDVSNNHLTANVVRTAAKLHFADDEDRVQRLGLCEICGLPMDENPKLRVARARGHDVSSSNSSNGISNGDSNGNGSIYDADARIYCLEPSPGEEGMKQRRCYGCRRTTQGAGKVDWPVDNR